LTTNWKTYEKTNLESIHKEESQGKKEDQKKSGAIKENENGSEDEDEEEQNEEEGKGMVLSKIDRTDPRIRKSKRDQKIPDHVDIRAIFKEIEEPKIYLDDFKKEVEEIKQKKDEIEEYEMTVCKACSKEWKKKSNQIVSLFTATSIPNPALMVLSMIVPTFFCMQQWSVSVISGPIFVPILYTVILIWSYGFKDTSISDSGVPDYVWNIVSACVAVSMSINTIPSTDHYYELIGKKIKKYFDDNDDNERGQILLAYITMALMFVFLLVSQ